MAKAGTALHVNYSSLKAGVIKTWHIHIEGLVQGVGFRPFVYQLSKRFELKGWINNNIDGVHIEFNAEASVANQFYETIIQQPPFLSRITKHSLLEIKQRAFESFDIIESETSGEANLFVTPDFAICENCKAELNAHGNRRFHYPFITCTQCGPRYSIISQVPYDRGNTTMKVFEMCRQCDEEYNDPLNRRHYSQTNSCHDCAIKMQLFNNKTEVVEEDQSTIIQKVCELWREGKIIAIKGVGGYLLTCDASKEATIKELRLRKHRPAKPFALMFPAIETLIDEVLINEQELNELTSVAAPIVLLRINKETGSGLALKEIAPGLSRIGVMLPYMPLYVLLMKQFNKPIIATSGNISNAPIVFRDEDALKELNNVADYVLVNNRDIIIPQDDSVIKYSTQAKQRIMLRHARGFAPFYPNRSVAATDKTVLATGAMLKSSFSLLYNRNIHVSQYLGNTENADAQNNFEHTANHFLNLFKCKPDVILTDKHPDYFSYQLAERLSSDKSVPLIKVQHHEAHFAAVLAENNLLDEQEPVLGVIWDGTGFGDDRLIWGGEFFVYHQKQFSRIHHFEYYDWILGDKMASEPRIAALSICKGMEEADEILRSKFSETEWNNYHKILSSNQLKTSSVGRIFDAVASLLGLIDKTSYEGEAAMKLEECAFKYFSNNPFTLENWLHSFESTQKNVITTESLIKETIKNIRNGKDTTEIAAHFHLMLVSGIEKIAVPFNCNKICFSGGVFQNGLLVDLVTKILNNQHQLYFHKHLPPNDENISFGQLMHYMMTSK